MKVDTLDPRGGAVPSGLGPAQEGMLVYADGVKTILPQGIGWYQWTLGKLVKMVASGPIFDFQVGRDIAGPVTSITTNGIVTLDGLAHGGYRFELVIYNPAGATVIYRMYFNNDQTNTDYQVYGAYAGQVQGNISTNDADISLTGLIASSNVSIVGNIIILPTGLVRATYLGFASDGRQYYETMRAINPVTGNNLTRLDVVASVASKIDVGSRVRLWRNM